MKKIFLLAVIIRLICLYLFRSVSNYDLQSYIQVGELTLKRIDIYPFIANLHHPYLPFFLYVEAAAIKLGQTSLMSQIGSTIIIKALLIVFDLGIIYLVYLLSMKNQKTTFLYAINPVTILITALHGQFDVIPVFFILLTIYLLNKKHELLSILSFSFAILTKTWPTLILIPIARKIKKKKFLILILFFPILFTSIYSWLFRSSLLDIAKTLVSYQGLWGIWGISELLGKQRVLVQKLTTLAFLTNFFVYSWIIKEKKLTKNILNLLFFFFVLTTNFSIQYFAWIIPFLVLIKPKKYFFLIILITMYLFSFYYFWIFCSRCNIVPNWLKISQNIIGFLLWLSFIKIGYLSRK